MSKALRLRGWKAIAAYLHVPERTARQYTSKYLDEQDRLPVAREPIPGSNRVWIMSTEIDAWLERCGKRRRIATGDKLR